MSSPGPDVRDDPYLSVITATFNRVQYLREAIASVHDQGRDDVEHIVVDGGSTDGTLEWLRTQKEFQVRLITGPDEGVYDAWNKGLRAARGAVVVFLNSDDVLADGAFEAVLPYFSDHSDAMVVCGGAEFYEEDFAPQNLKRVINDRSTKTLELSAVMRGLPIINARFFRRSVFDDVGLFDTSYAVAADKEFLLRVWRAGVVNSPVDPIVYRYRQHQGSLTLAAKGMVTRGQQEALLLSRNYMERMDVSAEMQREASRWHALKTGSLMWVCLHRGDYRGALRWAGEGWSADVAWPIRFLMAAIRARRRSSSVDPTSANRNGTRLSR